MTRIRRRSGKSVNSMIRASNSAAGKPRGGTDDAPDRPLVLSALEFNSSDSPGFEQVDGTVLHLVASGQRRIAMNQRARRPIPGRGGAAA